MLSQPEPGGPPSPPAPEPEPVRVKVCGVTTPANAAAIAAAGADWIGLNFHPGSARRVDPDAAAAIVAALPASSRPVALFVNRPPGEVAAVAGRLGISILQLHGDEPPEDLLALRGFEIVRAFRLADTASIDRMLAYLERASALGRSPDAILVDAYVAGRPGGTGQSIPADLLDHLPRTARLILAGGLTPANVADRVARVRPWMVDVAGGVESSPGHKDLDQVVAFLRAARGGSARPAAR